MNNSNYNNELDDCSSDEEIFYPTSNEALREDIDLPRRRCYGSRESKPNRDHRSLPRGQKLDCQDGRDEYSRQLLDSLEQQEQEIKNLDTKLRALGEEVREYFSNLEEKLSCFDEKMDLIVNLVSSFFRHSTTDRRCRGFCSKHVRTGTCLCRGLKEPHRCCGKISGVCDC